MTDAGSNGYKADFTGAYTSPDPRLFFATLRPLDYQVPALAQPAIRALTDALSRGRPHPTVLDLCCSYGINAALLRCRCDLGELMGRYTDPEWQDWPAERVRSTDVDFYQRRVRDDAPRVVGLDASDPAVTYAMSAGMLDEGWAENLEADDPSPSLAAGISGLDAIICTGGIGYVGPRTFERLLNACDEPGNVWVAAFVLRCIAYDDVADTLARYGLVTEQVPGLTVRQRRFASEEEQTAAVREVRARGLDPCGLEEDGWYYADCYLSSPADPAARASIVADMTRGHG